MKYNILSLDGGGIRGVFTAQILVRLQNEYPKLLDNVKLIAGTSTGGIIAIGLAMGLTPEQLVQLYAENGKAIFRKTIWDEIWDVGGIAGADYSSKPLKRILTKYFEGTRLYQLNKHVVIPSFELYKKNRANHSWDGKFFHNYEGDDSDGEELAVDVAMATSAAPTYFPSYNGYIDGGVVANNPSMCALTQAIKSVGTKLKDIRILSLGTGTQQNCIKQASKKNLNWGLYDWAKPISSMMIDANMNIAHTHCENLLKANQYRRFSIMLGEKVEMDDYKAVPYLIDEANSADLNGVVKWLKANWRIKIKST